jgi:hypothetical protein
MRRLLITFLLLTLPALATNYTVKSGGGGNFTTIAACTSQMSTNGTGVSDTCTVFAGTYNESVSVPAGSAGNYKILTVNGTDVVSVLSVTMSSHTKLIGNCPTAPSTLGTCGFSIQPASTSTACVSVGSTTDVFVRNNTAYECGTISMSSSASFIYIQGNTLSQMCRTPGTGGTCAGGGTTAQGNACDGIHKDGTNVLIEGNDISHYRLGIDSFGRYGIYRNNTFHDQIESEQNPAAPHTDAIFTEPVSEPSQYHLYEGNVHTNACGPNAKGFLLQGNACGGSSCNTAIIRFNSASHIDGTYTTNDIGSYYSVKEYNNTWVDTHRSGSYGGLFTNYYAGGSTNSADINSIFYYPAAVSNYNPVAVDSGTDATTFTYGHDIAYCTGGCSNLYGHVYNSGSFASDPGNKIADPKFTNYAGNDFHLQSGSPAIAAGTSLATANGSGTGSTSLVVNDASYFQDGMGLQNPYSTVQGDCISVTTVSNHICITAVNYSTNTLTLASPISWSNGDSIWLYSKSDGVRVLTGSAPDMGAFPFPANGAPPAAPTGLTAIVN